MFNEQNIETLKKFAVYNAAIAAIPSGMVVYDYASSAFGSTVETPGTNLESSTPEVIYSGTAKDIATDKEVGKALRSNYKIRHGAMEWDKRARYYAQISDAHYIPLSEYNSRPYFRKRSFAKMPRRRYKKRKYVTKKSVKNLIKNYFPPNTVVVKSHDYGFCYAPHGNRAFCTIPFLYGGSWSGNNDNLVPKRGDLGNFFVQADANAPEPSSATFLRSTVNVNWKDYFAEFMFHNPVTEGIFVTIWTYKFNGSNDQVMYDQINNQSINKKIILIYSAMEIGLTEVLLKLILLLVLI